MSFSSYFTHKPGGDRIFSVEAPKIKFGRGSLQEVGDDAKGLGMSRVAVYTDPRVVQQEPVAKVIESLRSSGMDVEVYDQGAVEPTDGFDRFDFRLLGDALNFRDKCLSVGGGRKIETINLTKKPLIAKGCFYLFVDRERTRVATIHTCCLRTTWWTTIARYKQLW